MRYISTRGGVDGISFCDAVLMGLASDGGLLVPAQIPSLRDELAGLQGCTYQEIAYRVMAPFADDLPADDLRSLIQRSYGAFADERIAPLVAVSDQLHIMELFHGPTLAFKDVALQFLGNLFEYMLAKNDATLNLLGATSGDTGSAAIAGVRGKERINIFVMFPEGRTSALQERQMTTVLDDNVHSLAIEGSFDDCQAILKSAFADHDFKEQYHLGAVNSVNWARVLAQTVYYFSAWVQLGCPDRFEVAVPTGNFGNIFAGYIAREMGLPIEHLILATNANDILHRFFTTGQYQRGQVHHSLSPAMDIQIASNFERYLYFMFDRQADKVRGFMQSFADKGVAAVQFNTVNVDGRFKSGSVSDKETRQCIKDFYEQEGYVADPHTAVGIAVARQVRDPTLPLVCLATAHPAKFDEALGALGDGIDIRHEALEALRTSPSARQPWQRMRKRSKLSLQPTTD
ncbi:MAG: threonine synthase [Pseudomonadales bacterium]